MGDEGEKTHRLSGADQKLKWRKYGTQLEKAIQKLQVKWLWTLSRNWNLHDWRTTLYKLKLKQLQFTNTWLTVWFSVCYVIQKFFDYQCMLRKYKFYNYAVAKASVLTGQKLQAKVRCSNTVRQLQIDELHAWHSTWNSWRHFCSSLYNSFIALSTKFKLVKL